MVVDVVAITCGPDIRASWVLVPLLLLPISNLQISSFHSVLRHFLVSNCLAVVFNSVATIR